MMTPPRTTDSSGSGGLFWPRKRTNEHPNLRFVRYLVEEITPWQIRDPVHMGLVFSKWIGALASVLTIGYDGLIDDSKIRHVEREPDANLPFGFPGFPIERTNLDLRTKLSDFSFMMNFYRNAFAHGNIELLPGILSMGMRGDVLQAATGVDFVAIAIWQGPRKRPHEQRYILYLDFDDVVDLVFATAKLCEEKAYWTNAALQWSQDAADSFHGLRPARHDIEIVRGEPFKMKFAIYEPLDVGDESD